jgi:signal transduction histidine kinase
MYDPRLPTTRLVALQSVTAAFSAVLTPAEVTAVAVTLGCEALGAAGCGVRLLSRDGQWLERVHYAGYTPDQMMAEDRVPITFPLPNCAAARDRMPVWFGSESAWEARLPATVHVLRRLGHQAAAAFPLMVGDRLIGAMTVSFEEPQLFDPDDRAFMITVARLTAEAIDRAGYFAAERARADRLAGLQAVTAALSAVRTPQEVAGVVLGKGCEVLGAMAASVRVRTADGQALDRLVNPSSTQATLPYERLSLDEQLPVCDAVRTGEPVWLRTPDEMRTSYPITVGPVLEAGYRASATLPLNVAGTPIGTIGFSFAQAQHFDSEDRDFMLTLAELTAQALDRARLYAAEQERARVAEELARIRNTVVGMVSHELRTPLTAIVGYAEILEARWTSLTDAKRLDWVAKIKQSANRQSRLVEDVLLMSHLEQGGLVMRSEAAQVELLARRAATEITVTYAGQIVDLRGRSDLFAIGDPGRIVQILIILLDNAAKYSAQGSAISLSWAREIDTIVLRVADTGCGIPPESHHRLFRPFGRLEGSRPRGGRGSTGLGLYLGRELASGMGGMLTLESSSPDGSIFALRLPARSAG